MLNNGSIKEILIIDDNFFLAGDNFLATPLRCCPVQKVKKQWFDSGYGKFDNSIYLILHMYRNIHIHDRTSIAGH